MSVDSAGSARPETASSAGATAEPVEPDRADAVTDATAARDASAEEVAAAVASAIDYSKLRQFDEKVGAAAAFDPLRLCVFTTIALIAAITGPFATLVFAVVAIAGYAKARRAGLMRSRCKLGDTRLVLAYLGVIAVGSLVAIPFWVLGVVKLVS